MNNENGKKKQSKLLHWNTGENVFYFFFNIKMPGIFGFSQEINVQKWHSDWSVEFQVLIEICDHLLRCFFLQNPAGYRSGIDVRYTSVVTPCVFSRAPIIFHTFCFFFSCHECWRTFCSSSGSWRQWRSVSSPPPRSCCLLASCTS